MDNSKNENVKYKIALVGNPNVGKSTVFNGLTGMNQHTGNWPGKTVETAYGYFKRGENSYLLTDTPGTYSLLSHSPEEEIARNYICFEGPDAVIVVSDATCLERNLNLALQVAETGANMFICLNLLDEAKRKGINIDVDLISNRIGVPIIGTVARDKKSLENLISTLDIICTSPKKNNIKIQYPNELEEEISKIEALIPDNNTSLSKRFTALRLIEGDEGFIDKYAKPRSHISEEIVRSRKRLKEKGIDEEKLKDIIVSSLIKKAEEICEGAVTSEKGNYKNRDRKLDRLFTSRLLGYPIMLLLLAVVFWITIKGANYPSDLLSSMFASLGVKLEYFLSYIGVQEIINDALINGVYRVLSWVISVMLPPMAIFFPFFTLLEDSGYLPRIAYNLDKPFKCSGACGKQALSMCMGFGCNAAGVVGCRIIDSPRERLLAILTNSLVPCNGRFPTLIALITMFLAVGSGMFASISSAVILTFTVIFGILMTFLATKLLSATILKGKPSSFTLEMPPYRRPQIGKVIIRSIFDRTLFVLSRSIAFAAPCGLVLWLFANIEIGEVSLLSHSANFLDPLGRLMGLDGVILLAFILGLPANEIVIPIIIMTYLSERSLLNISDMDTLRELFISNGWTVHTAVSMLIFTLFHWPCSTTLMTIKKETGSTLYTAVSLLLPTVFGAVLCILYNLIF
ncbi:MAG: ferrous iron transport protein B [Clostridia bacterium]|nr:ferrous iron transport protein B [Clostridia bacterium]